MVSWSGWAKRTTSFNNGFLSLASKDFSLNRSTVYFTFSYIVHHADSDERFCVLFPPPATLQTMNQLLEKMKQGEHVFDVNADIEPDEEECQDFGDNFDADCEEMGQGDFGGEGLDEHKESCANQKTDKR